MYNALDLFWSAIYVIIWWVTVGDRFTKHSFIILTANELKGQIEFTMPSIIVLVHDIYYNVTEYNNLF